MFSEREENIALNRHNIATGHACEILLVPFEHSGNYMYHSFKIRKYYVVYLCMIRRVNSDCF